MPKCTPNLRKLRLKAQLSQNQFSRLAGVDRQTISNAERGLDIAELTLEKLLAALRKALGQELTADEISTDAAG